MREGAAPGRLRRNLDDSLTLPASPRATRQGPGNRRKTIKNESKSCQNARVNAILQKNRVHSRVSARLGETGRAETRE